MLFEARPPSPLVSRPCSESSNTIQGDKYDKGKLHVMAARSNHSSMGTCFQMQPTEAKTSLNADTHPPQMESRDDKPALGLKDGSKMIKNGSWHASAKQLVKPPCKLAFVYGTLKKGFGNYWLMEELMLKGHAHFVGAARTKKQYPLVCGPFQVPFLLNIPASGYHVRGEVYQVDQAAITRLDELEGVHKGHYVRCPVVLTSLKLHPTLQLDISLDPASLRSMALHAEAYFAASSYTPGLARAPYIESFTEKEASTYVRRKDRPQHRTFLEHIFAWIEEHDHVRDTLKPDS